MVFITLIILPILFGPARGVCLRTIRFENIGKGNAEDPIGYAQVFRKKKNGTVRNGHGFARKFGSFVRGQGGGRLVEVRFQKISEYNESAFWDSGGRARFAGQTRGEQAITNDFPVLDGDARTRVGACDRAQAAQSELRTGERPFQVALEINPGSLT